MVGGEKRVVGLLAQCVGLYVIRTLRARVDRMALCRLVKVLLLLNGVVRSSG